MDQIKPVLEWIKAHLMITAMSLLAIAFIFCGWYFSGGLKEQLASDVQARTKEFQKLDKAAKTSVSLPMTDGDFTANGTLNKNLLDKLEVLANQMSTDLDEATISALGHNGDPHPGAEGHPQYQERITSEGPAYPGIENPAALKSWRAAEKERRLAGTKRLLVSERVFPNPPAARKENLPNEVHAALIASYAAMIDDFGGGAPPALEDVEKELARDRSNFIQRDLNKGTAADLDAEEKERVSTYLGEERLKLYAEASRNLLFYAEPSAFNLPEDPFVTKTTHALEDLYEWHWNWWIAEDVVAAIARANTRPDGTPTPVISAPVKRLVSLTTLSAPVVNAQQGGSNAGRGSGGRSPRGSRNAGAGTGSTGPSGPLGEPNVSLDVAVQPDYTVSLTGRKSNALFDVRSIQLVVVVETASLPALVDALAQENFVTITDMSLQPASAFEAAEFGYMFGAEPVSRVTLTLETVWFRKWTAPWMPQTVRDALGIQAAASGSQG